MFRENFEKVAYGTATTAVVVGGFKAMGHVKEVFDRALQLGTDNLIANPYIYTGSISAITGATIFGAGQFASKFFRDEWLGEGGNKVLLGASFAVSMAMVGQILPNAINEHDKTQNVQVQALSELPQRSFVIGT